MIYVYLIDWIMPLSAIFQLYHGDQVTVVVEKTGVSRENQYSTLLLLVRGHRGLVVKVMIVHNNYMYYPFINEGKVEVQLTSSSAEPLT
jgi:hypothetical protein